MGGQSLTKKELLLRLKELVDRNAELEAREAEHLIVREALERSDMLLRKAFATIPDLVAVIDRDFRILLSNWHGGYDYVPEQERCGNPFCYKAYYGRETPCEPCHVREVFRSGKAVSWEKSNPNIGQVEIRAYPICDDSGNVVLVAESIRNITVQKQAEAELARYREHLEELIRERTDDLSRTNEALVSEIAERTTIAEALRASEGRLNAIIDGSPLPIFVIDADHSVVSWNKAMELCSSVSARDMIGTNRHWCAFYAEGRPCLADLLVGGEEEMISRMFGGKCRKSPVIEGAYECIDFFPLMGSEGKWLYFTAKVIRDEHGVVIGAVEMLEDITERKNIEEVLLEKHEKLLTITNTARDAIVMMDDEGKISFWNPAARTIFGYSAAEALGRELHAFLAPGRYHESYRKGFEYFSKTGKGDAVGRTLELTAIRKGGEEFPVELSLSAFRTGGRWFAAGILRDITERKQAEAELIRTNEELTLRTRELLEAQDELVSKEKLAVLGRLAGSVGHELRNPLGVLNNAVYFLKTVLTDADETVKEYLDIIKQEVDNSQRIITALLDFSHIRPPATTPAPVERLVEVSLRRCAVPANVTVRIDIPATLPLVNVDSQQIGQVFENLVSNAVEALPEGGTLRIAARKAKVHTLRSAESPGGDSGTMALCPGSGQGNHILRSTGGMIEIRFEDSGEGIPEENMKKIFHPLFTTRPRRIGLGLTVCRTLIEANGGMIAAESRGGAGATFIVLLPMASGA